MEIRLQENSPSWNSATVLPKKAGMQQNITADGSPRSLLASSQAPDWGWEKLQRI